MATFDSMLALATDAVIRDQTFVAFLFSDYVLLPVVINQAIIAIM